MAWEEAVPWRTSSVIEERLQFAILAKRGQQSFKSLCAEFGISRQTGYTWKKRFQDGGARELTDRSRRPKQSPRRTSATVEAAVVEARQKWPDWGAPKLAKILEEQDPPVKVDVRTVHRILERHGLIRASERPLRGTTDALTF